MDAYLVALASFGLIYLLLVVGLNLQYGFAGLTNFGVVGFYALGAYTAAILATRGVPVPLALAGAMIVAMLPAFLLGLLSLRLRDDYLAVVTLGFAELVKLVVTNEAWLTRGTHGIPDIPPLVAADLAPAWRPVVELGVLLAINVVALYAIWRIVRSPFGRAIFAIREDETAVIALGKDPLGFKIKAFMIGAALAGLAGGLQAHHLSYISPEQFLPILTFYVWIAVLIGGVGTLSGTVVGTAILILLLEGSRFLRDLIPGVSETDLASARLMVVGIAIVVVTIHRPEGIMGRAAK